MIYFKYGLSAKQMKKYVKKFIPNYSETTDIFKCISDKQNDALKRAKLLHNSQEKVHDSVYSHECNPYTNIFEFIEYVDKIKRID